MLQQKATLLRIIIPKILVGIIVIIIIIIIALQENRWKDLLHLKCLECTLGPDESTEPEQKNHSRPTDLVELACTLSHLVE